jgi:hypothetical protein
MLFRDGAICFAVIHDHSPKSIESLLVEWGVIDEPALSCIEKSLRNYGSLLDCLDGEGLVSKTHLESFISSRLREFVYEVFKWDQGECRFIEEELDERREILVPMNTENLILEGARRIDEWSNIKSKVPSRHSVFRFCSENEGDQRLNLKPREWEILSLVEGKHSVNEINNAVGGDLFSTSKLIYGLVIMGVIELVGNDQDDDSGTNSEERLQGLVRKGMEYYSRLNLEKAVEKFEAAVKIDNECFEALRMLGEIYYKMDKLSEALIYLRKARSSNPDNQKTIFIKGYCHARMGEVNLAIKEWQELREKAKNPKIVELVKRRISAAREWEKVLQEY